MKTIKDYQKYFNLLDEELDDFVRFLEDSNKMVFDSKNNTKTHILKLPNGELMPYTFIGNDIYY